MLKAQFEWRWLLVELVVVFLGLLAALQVDEWREQKERSEIETRYLLRLQSDLTGFLEQQAKFLVLLNRNYSAVKHVSDSLIEGAVLDGNDKHFEEGLIYVGMLPSINIPRATYDEMIASGFFVWLGSEELKETLSNLYSTHSYTELNFRWWRNIVLALARDLVLFVNHRSTETPGENFDILHNEPQRTVEYTFDQLASSAEIRGGYYWAVDVHSDWIGQYAAISELASKALHAVENELENR